MPAERPGARAAAAPLNAPFAGAVLVGLHVLVLAGLLARCQRPGLTLAVPAEATALLAPDGRLGDDARLPAGLAERVRLTVDGAEVAPGVPPSLRAGVHRVEWQAAYRGGFVHKVGRTVLAGPLQDPAHPPCGVRLVVGQALLDELEPILVARVSAGLRGQLGFRKVEDAELVLDAGDAKHPAAIALSMVLKFSQGRVPVSVRVVPRLAGGQLTLAAEVLARVKLESRVLAEAVELFGQTERLNRAARDVARGEVDKVLGPVAAFLAAPPPVPLGRGRVLALAYCPAEAITIVHARSLSVPLAVPVMPMASGLLPVLLPERPPPGPPDSPIAIDVSLDAANAILHQMWASGALDVLVAEQGLERTFNESAEVRDLLTVRAGVPTLALPPTLEASGIPSRPISLSIEAELALLDGALRTTARLYGRVALDLRSDARLAVVADVDVTDLALTCVPAPGRLAPCYVALFEAARARSADLHPPIAAALVRWFEHLVADRQLGGLAGAPRFVLTGARLTPRIDDISGWFRVELRGQVLDD